MTRSTGPPRLRKTDEDLGLSEILARLQIQAIYRRSTVDCTPRVRHETGDRVLPRGQRKTPPISRACTRIARQNTIDLQWKMRANYNARPCDGDRKAAGAATMASNGKSNAQSNRNSRKSGRVLRSGCERLTSSDVLACGPWRPNEKRPPTRAGDNSHKSETRISAIADLARKGKREKKALPLSPRSALTARGCGPRASLVRTASCRLDERLGRNPPIAMELPGHLHRQSALARQDVRGALGQDTRAAYFWLRWSRSFSISDCGRSLEICLPTNSTSLSSTP